MAQQRCELCWAACSPWVRCAWTGVWLCWVQSQARRWWLPSRNSRRITRQHPLAQSRPWQFKGRERSALACREESDTPWGWQQPCLGLRARGRRAAEAGHTQVSGCPFCSAPPSAAAGLQHFGENRLHVGLLDSPPISRSFPTAALCSPDESRSTCMLCSCSCKSLVGRVQQRFISASVSSFLPLQKEETKAQKYIILIYLGHTKKGKSTTVNVQKYRILGQDLLS